MGLTSLELLQNPEARKEAFRVRREAEQRVSENPAVFIRQLVKDVRHLLEESGDAVILNGNIWGKYHTAQTAAVPRLDTVVKDKFDETGADSVCEVCLGGAYFMGGLGLDQKTLPMNSLMDIVQDLENHEGFLSEKKKRENGITRTALKLIELSEIACGIDELRSGNIYSFLEYHLKFCWSRKKQGGVFWVLPAHPEDEGHPIRRIPLESAKGVPFFEPRRGLVEVGLSRLEILAAFLDVNLRRRKIRNRAELENYSDRYEKWQSDFSDEWTGWGT